VAGGVLELNVLDDSKQGLERKRVVSGEVRLEREGVLGEELGEVLEQVGAVQRAVVVEIELGGQARDAQELEKVVDGDVLVVVGDFGRVGDDGVHELEDEVLELELEVAALGLEEEEGNAESTGVDRGALVGEEVVEFVAEVVCDVGEQGLVGGDVVDAELEADGEEVEAHGDHDVGVLGADEGDEEAEEFADTRQAVGNVGGVDPCEGIE
jgi:hypothetical protein